MGQPSIMPYSSKLIPVISTMSKVL
jgi:hypothetical protein